MQIVEKFSFKEWLKNNNDFCISLINKQGISNKLKAQLKQSLKELLQDKKDIYIPRNIYGFFLQDEARKIIEKLQHAGCKVTVLSRSKIIAVEETSRTSILGGLFFRQNKTIVKINLGDKKYFFDKVLITAGNTIDKSSTPNFLYIPNIKSKIIKLILDSIRLANEI